MSRSRDGLGQAFAGITPRVPPKASHLVARALRHMILTGELAADQLLPPEAELATAFSVSKETLREALRVLESQSLVEIRRGRGGGPVVRSPGVDAASRYVALLLQRRGTTFAHLESARQVVELPAAERFAGKVSEEGLGELVGRHDRERSAVGDPVRFAAAVAEFDQSVTEGSGNRSLGVIAGIFREIHAAEVFQMLVDAGPDRAASFARRVIVSHSAFVDAARRHDHDLAVQAWIDYLDTSDALIATPGRRRSRLDVTSLWRAQGRGEAGPATRRPAAVANEIRARIAAGELAEGTRLASLPELAAEFGVSRPTLREALRVLEMERLLDIGAGDRSGAVVLAPSTLTAAGLAGIALEGRSVTFADFFGAYRLIEPPVRQIAAMRMSRRTIASLRRIGSQLDASATDNGAFMGAWQRADSLVLSDLGNPALTIIGEVTRCVAREVERIASGGAPQWADDLRKHSLTAFRGFVEAAEARDGARARQVWTDYMERGAPFFERSEIADRPLAGLVDGGALA